MSAFEDYVNLELPRRSTLLTKALTGGYDANPNLGGAPSILQNAPNGAWFYEETADIWWRKRESTPGTWTDTTVSGGGGGFTRIEEVFTPTPAQTVFTLSGAPATPNDTSMFVNTAKYIYGVDYTVAVNQLTWLDVEFTLDTSDTVEIIWFL
jgi:hypothetical protein